MNKAEYKRLEMRKNNIPTLAEEAFERLKPEAHKESGTKPASIFKSGTISKI